MLVPRAERRRSIFPVVFQIYLSLAPPCLNIGPGRSKKSLTNTNNTYYTSSIRGALSTSYLTGVLGFILPLYEESPNTGWFILINPRRARGVLTPLRPGCAVPPGKRKSIVANKKPFGLAKLRFCARPPHVKRVFRPPNLALRPTAGEAYGCSFAKSVGKRCRAAGADRFCV